MLHNVETNIYSQSVYSHRSAGGLEKLATLYAPLIGTFQSKGGFSLTQVPRKCVLHIITGGNGEFHFDGKKYNGTIGDAVVFFQGVHTHYCDDPHNPWQYTWLHLEGAAAEEVLTEIGFTREEPCKSNVLNPVLQSVVEGMIRSYRIDSASEYYPVISAWQIMDALNNDKTIPNVESISDLAVLSRFIIDTEYMNPITINDITRRLGTTRYTLFRHFRSCYGLAPKEYLQEVRMGQARDLLSRPGARVKDTAYAVGFGNPQYFSRVFKQYYGMSPGQYAAV